MPADDIFMVGTGGSLTHESIAVWYGEHAAADRMDNVCMPFVGMGRIMSGVCRPTTSIDVCDFQRISTGVIEGVFAADQWRSAVDLNAPRLRRGRAYDLGDKFIQGIDEGSAGFIDWIKMHGTYLDQMCVGMAVPGQTERGRMGNWVGSFDNLFSRFATLLEQSRRFIPRPGDWTYWEADFFDLMDWEYWPWRGYYDLLVLDLPYLSGGLDMYSTGAWNRLNEVLGGTATIKPWTYQNYWSNLRTVLQIKSEYLMISWTDVKTSRIIPSEMLAWFLQQTHGELEDEQRWSVRPKTLFGWKIRRGDSEQGSSHSVGRARLDDHALSGSTR